MKNIEASGYLIYGDWGTYKRSTAFDTLEYIRSIYPHILILDISDSNNLNNDIEFIASIYEALKDPELLGEQLSSNHLKSFLVKYYHIFDDLTQEDHLLADQILSYQQYISLEEKRAAKNIHGSNDIYDTLIQKIKSRYDRINDQNLFIEKRVYLIKAMVLDILEAIFPIDSEFKSIDEYPKKLEPGTLPVRIAVNVSKADSVMSGIQSFVKYGLIDLIQSVSLNDLNNNTYQSNEDIKVGDLLEFFPVVTACNEASEKISSDLEQIQKNYLEKEEVKSIVEEYGLDKETSLERVWHLYNGHPRLTEWHLDMLRQGTKEKDFIDDLSNFTQSAFEYLPDQTRFLIYALAIFGKADKRLIWLITEDNDSFWFELLSNYYFIDKVDEYISIKKPFRLLASYLQFDSETTEYLEYVSETYTGISHELKDYPDEDLNKLRILSHFDRFSIPAVKDYPIGEKVMFSDIEELIDIYPNSFIKNQNTYSIEPNLRLVLRKYSSLHTDDSELSKLPHTIWDEYKKALSDGKLSVERDKKIRIEEQKSIENKIRKLKQNEKKLSGEVQHLKEQLGKVLNALGQFAEKKNDKLSFTFLFFGLTAFLLYLLSSSVFSGLFSHNETIDLAAGILLFISIILLLLSSKLIYRLVIGAIKKDEIEKSREKRASLENGLLAKEKQIDQIRADINASEDRIIELNKDLMNNNREQELIDHRLKEPFID